MLEAHFDYIVVGAGTAGCLLGNRPSADPPVRVLLLDAGGEWRVERPRVSWEILDAFRDAAAQVGISPSEEFNRGDDPGCGYFEVNQGRGVRWNAS